MREFSDDLERRETSARSSRWLFQKDFSISNGQIVGDRERDESVALLPIHCPSWPNRRDLEKLETRVFQKNESARIDSVSKYRASSQEPQDTCDSCEPSIVQSLSRLVSPTLEIQKRIQIRFRVGATPSAARRRSSPGIPLDFEEKKRKKGVSKPSLEAL